MARLFVALPVDAAVADLAERVIDRLRSVFGPDPPLRFPPPESLHVTLAFLGEVEPDAVPGIEAILERVAARHGPGPAEVGGVGAFPRIDRARVLWLGFGSGDPALAALVEDLGRSLRSAGQAIEHRAWTGHVTLARARSPRGFDARTALDALGPLADRSHPSGLRLRAPVTEMVLMESRPSPKRPRYIPVFRASFVAQVAAHGSTGVQE